MNINELVFPMDVRFRQRNPLGSQGASLAVTEQLERNKRTVTAFYGLMFSQCKPAEAIERHAGDVYIQHNPAVADGKEAFIAYFEQMAEEYPGKHVDFKRVISGATIWCFIVISNG